MSTTLKLVLRRDKINAAGKAPVYLRITKSRKTSYIATDIKLELKYWDEKNAKVKVGYPNSSRANNYLNNFLLKYEDEILKEQSITHKLSVRTLKEKITGGNNLSYFEVAEDLIKIYKARHSVRTYNRSKSIVNKLRNYLGSDNLSFYDISVAFLSKYEKYLRDEKKNMTNTIHKDLEFIRRVFHHAEKLGFVDPSENPFLRYKLRMEKTTRTYLNEDEIIRVEKLALIAGSRIELHRDMFIFACYAGGIRVSDLLMLKNKNFDGTHINFTTRKTSNQHFVKLPNKALAIIDRYKSTKGDSFLFPVLTEKLNLEDAVVVAKAISSATAYLNKNLKVLAAMAGLNKSVSMHCSRHSFATLALRKGISIDKVSKLLNHSKITETQLYAKLINSELDKAMDEAFN